MKKSRKYSKVLNEQLRKNKKIGQIDWGYTWILEETNGSQRRGIDLRKRKNQRTRCIFVGHIEKYCHNIRWYVCHKYECKTSQCLTKEKRSHFGTKL